MRVQRVGGAVAFKRTREGEYLALVIQHSGGYWEFPKGKQDPGEDDRTTALRELKEETGLMGEITDEQPVEVSHTFEHDGVEERRDVCYFFVRVPDEAQVHMQPGEVLDHAWLSLEDLEEQVTYPSMKTVARRACAVLAD